MRPSLTVVDPEGQVPLVVRLFEVASAEPDGVVLVAPPQQPAPRQRLVELLTGPYGIGVVLPMGESDHGDASGSRDVNELSASCFAVRASVVLRSSLAPISADAATVSGELLKVVRRGGLRVVGDSEWSTGAPTLARSRQTGDSRILVVTGPLAPDGLRFEDRAVRELIGSLSGQVRHGAVTVMTTERADSEDMARWAAEGMDVLEGPETWAAEPAQRGEAYSHVVVTSSAARSSVRTWIDMLHPQAAKVVYFPGLSFREVSRLLPITPPDEVAGLDLVRIRVEDGDAGLAAWADMVWCQWPGDADFLRGLAPTRSVLCIPPALTCPAPRLATARHGLVIVATEGHDVLAANEDAAVRSLQEIVAQIRPAGGEAASCTVVSDSPTPMLVEASRAAGARIVASSALGEEIRAARLMLSAHQYGGGQPEAIALCLESGTPFVVTPEAAGDFDLGSLATVAVCGSVADMATRSRQLLFDDRRWSMFANEASEVLAARYDPAFRSKAMSAGLAALGVTPGEVRVRWPSRPVTHRLPRPLLKLGPDLRPGPVVEPPPLDQEAPSTERERYQIWSQRHGASAEVVRRIRQDLQRLTYRPRISILMPVYNTDPSVLLAAIDSVLAQVYDHWQLCIANDGSDRPETLDVLASLSGDKRITLVNLPGSSGIAGATNAALNLAEGEYVTFLDHDDELKPHALAQVARWLDTDPALDVVYSDEDKIDPDGSLYDPHIKPDWSPDQLTAQNYVCHLTVARRALVKEVGGLRSEFDGSQDFDLILRLTEKTDRIAHIPEPLYSWRAVPGSAAADAEAKPYAIEAARRAIGAALERRGYGGRVDQTERVGFFRARYPIPGRPRVSIVIPTKNGLHLLERCIGSILDKSTYRNFDILVVDNQSTEAETLAYLASMPWRLIRYPQRFNYARMMNLAARAVECDALLFLNNDTEVITPDWIEALLEHAMRPEVGAVGGRLYFGSGEPQHEGIMVGVGGGWAHNLNHRGYWGRGDLVRNVSAVTGACTMIRPSVYWRVGGNDERLRVAYNDVDLCMRIRQAGYQIVYTPFAELYHYESSSRGGYEHHEDGPLFGIRWHPKVIGDDYYSPMFDIDRPFVIKV